MTIKSKVSHAVLIPEILSNVFSTLEASDLYSATLVCLSWSELCLNELWKDMDSVLPLLKVLEEMTLLYDKFWVSSLMNLYPHSVD